jgi:flagellar assembly protein FliH
MSSSADLRIGAPRVGILRGLVPSAEPVVTDARAGLRGGPVGAAVARDARLAAEEAGYADGYAEGLAAGEAAAQAQAAALHEGMRAALAGLQQAAADLRVREAASLADVADQAAALALDIAEAVLGREIASSADPGRDAIARAIGFVPEEGAVTVRLNPADHGRLGDVADLLPGRDAALVADPSVGSGGCVVQVGATRIDAQISAALHRVAEVLR